MAPLDALAVDVLTKCLEFVPFDEVHTTAKELSRGLRSAARRALTRGRWRPLKLFCARGRDELFGDFELITGTRTGTRFDDPTDGSTYARPVVSDQTRSLFREVWALEPSEVLFEIWGWPVVAAEERYGTHVECLEGAIRFLDVVEPSLDGFGRIVGAISDRARWAVLQTTSNGAWADEWAKCLLVQWTCKILELRGSPDEMQLFLELQPDLGLFTWSEPKAIARWIVRDIWQFCPTVAEFVRDGWRNRREAEVLVAVAEEA